MITKEGSTKNVNFMTPGAGFLVLGHGHTSLKCIISLKIFFSIHMQHRSDKLSICNDVQGRVYQNCKFHDPWGRGSCARAWPYQSYRENALSSLSVYSTLIAFVLIKGL